MARAKLSTASRRCNVSFIDFAAVRGNYTAREYVCREPRHRFLV